MNSGIHDLNEVILRGSIMNIRIQRGWRTIQVSTDAGGVRNFNNGYSMTPIVYVFDDLDCPEFTIRSHVELYGHIQPLKTRTSSDRVYDEVIAVDRLKLVQRDLSYEFRGIKNMDGFDPYDGGYPDDMNKSRFVGTFLRCKEISTNGSKIPRISVRLSMKTADRNTGQETENIASIICYGKQAEYIRQNAKEGTRLAITARTRTFRVDSKRTMVLQQQMAKDVFILP